MDSSKGPCPHQGLPVETDESLTSFGLDEVWPPGSCKQCSGPPERPHHGKADGAGPDVSQWRLTESQYHPELRAAAHDAPRRGFMPSNHAGPMNPALSADLWPHGFRYNMMPCELDLRANPSRGFGSSSHHPQDHSMEDSERLERPHTLMSDVNCTHCVPDRYHPAPTPGREPIQGALLRQFPCCPQENLYPLNGGYHRNPAHPAGPHLEPQQHRQPDDRMYFRGAPNAPGASHPRFEAPPIDAVHEVSVDRSHPAGPGSGTKEMRRTIHLPEECRNVFITYSMDTANEIIPFVKFLVDQGFEPAIDMFDNPIRRMSILKWMDRFLNDNSVLIIVVISPKYKEDVEGDGDDEHGLHTKYIHNQIQQEFIQQRCRNFRLVPVMFPNATKKHVPNWLQSTRIYRWPQDTQDLLLRLFREERYIIPQRGGDLTLTVRPL